MNAMFDWYVGIDWASEVHQVCLVDATGAASAPCATAARSWRQWRSG
jgi:hypothetical protein